MRKIFLLISVLSTFLLCACATKASSISSTSLGSDYPDQMTFSNAVNEDILIYNCGDTYLLSHMGGNDWRDIYGKTLPDGYSLNEGEFAYVNADIERVSGGIKGYVNAPYIKKIKSIQKATVDEMINNGYILDYDPTLEYFTGPAYCNSNGNCYCIAKPSYQDYHIYLNEKLVGKCDTAFEAEQIMGIRTNNDLFANLDKKNNMRMYVFRCGDIYLARVNDLTFSNDPVWTRLLNEDFENKPEGFTLEDGESIYFPDADIIRVNGGNGNYNNAPMLVNIDRIEECSFDTIASKADTHWEDNEPMKNGMLSQYHVCEYAIFFIDGQYHVYHRSASDNNGEFIGIFDSVSEVDEAMGYER